MAATYVIVTNATSNQLSLVGDAGTTRFDISASAGANTINIDMNDLLGNVLLCGTLSTWITSSYVTVTRGGNTMTAAMLTAWEQGSDMASDSYDDDDNAIVDGAAQVLELVVGHADLTAAATTEVLAFADLPATAIVLGTYAVVTEVFTGASITACTLDVGVATGGDELLNGGNILLATGNIGTPFGSAPVGPYFGDTLDITVDTTGANVSVLATGAMTIRVIYIEAVDVNTAL